MSALLRTLAVFVLILLIGRLKLPRTGKRVPLTIAILIGAAALGGLFGLDGGTIARKALGALVKGDSLVLGAVLLLLSLSLLMERSGQTDRIVHLARLLLRRPAVTMSALPALIGLLPMPGGALFSAPMVRAAAGEASRDAGLLSAVNYWFRHIWEHWWPLYPGVLLATTYIKGGYATLAPLMLPLGIAMLAAGLLIFRGTHGDLHATAATPPPAGTRRRLLWATSPIWIIIVVWLPAFAALWFAARAGFEPPAVVAKYGPVVAGLLVSFLWTVAMNRHDLRQTAAVFARPSSYILIGLVMSVMVFQGILESTGAAERIAAELAALHVPTALVVSVLPFIAGAITGVAVGLVGVSFPIVVPVAAAHAGDGSVLPYIVLAYGFGHLGMMLSPLHVCYVVSNRYFDTPFGPVYRRMLPAAVAMGLAIVVYFLALGAAL
ncbi:MAG: DUF401 family protein [Planctomycetes bacterium]|nr:DUF401 family protein [Planctomycetota bacterium]